MGEDRLFHVLDRHPQRDAEPLVRARVDIDRDCPADDQRVDGAPVDVAGHDDLVPRLADAHHHRLDAGAGAPDHQKGVGRPEGVGQKLFRLPDNRNRVAEVVQRLHRVHIRADAVRPEEIPERFIAPAALMAGDVEMYHTGIPDAGKRLDNRDPVLIQFSHNTIPNV